jgi:signal transduction histidine kinase
MNPRPSLIIVRVAALAAWGIIGVQMVLAPNAPVYRAWFVRAVVYALHLAFGAAFWFNTRRIQGRSPTRTSVTLLALQATIALFISSDLLLLASLEVPFIFFGRAAVRWMVTQAAASIARPLLAVAGFGVFVPIPYLGHLPYGAAVIFSILYLITWEGLAFVGGHVAATQYRNARELARVNAELRATQQLLAANSRLSERLHISRELHDAMGHHLAALSLNLELASLRAADGPVAEPVREAKTVAKELLAEVRDMVSGLRQDRAFDLRDALETLVEGISEPRIHLELPEQMDLADPTQATAVFRCVQEAVTNAIRHAGASNLWIDIRREPERLEVRVRDDGQGTADPAPGHGLTGMRERFAEAGGGLEITSAPGRGFRLHAWLPVAGEQT